MSDPKTTEQIDAEIAAMEAVKPTVPQYSFFGDDNNVAIDAQLQVLRERMTADQVYETWGDEDADDFKQHTLDAAIEAQGWMAGLTVEDAPSSGWSTTTDTPPGERLPMDIPILNQAERLPMDSPALDEAERLPMDSPSLDEAERLPMASPSLDEDQP